MSSPSCVGCKGNPVCWNTLPETATAKAPENCMIGRQSFPFGAIWAYFHVLLLLVLGRVYHWTHKYPAFRTEAYGLWIWYCAEPGGKRYGELEGLTPQFGISLLENCSFFSTMTSTYMCLPEGYWCWSWRFWCQISWKLIFQKIRWETLELEIHIPCPSSTRCFFPDLEDLTNEKRQDVFPKEP